MNIDLRGLPVPPLRWCAAVLLLLFSCRTGVAIPSAGEGGASPPARESAAARAKALVGRWVRTDAYYVIDVALAGEEGAVKVGYFNPKPVNVGRAEYSDSVAGLVLTVVLQDVNYPGSTYILTYDREHDALVGTYFQAVQGVTFDVAFVRQR